MITLRCKVWECGRSFGGIPGLKPACGMVVSLLCLLRTLWNVRSLIEGCPTVWVSLRVISVSYRVGVTEGDQCVLPCGCHWGWSVCSTVWVSLRVISVFYRVGVTEGDQCVLPCGCHWGWSVQQ